MDKELFTLLIIEDEDQQLSLFQEEVNDFNDAGHECQFAAITASTAKAAFEKLASKYIDCAIVDLRLPQDEAGSVDAQRGCQMLEHILQTLPIPVVVVSGVPGEIHDVAPGSPIKNSPIKILRREGDAYTEALTWLREKTGLMRTLRNAQSSIRQETARLFHRSIWPRWEKRTPGPDKPELPEKAITRQIVCHLAEYLTVTGGTEAFFIPDEFYLDPPMRTERLHTGDLLEHEKQVWIIVTPQCNMANDPYPDNILLAGCRDERQQWKQLITRKEQGGKKQESANRQIRDLVNQGHDISTHFMPPCGDRGPWLVEFKKIKTLHSDKDEVSELLKTRFASLAPQFIPNLTQRFAAYMGRNGQPDLDRNELVQYMKMLIDTGPDDGCSDP